MQERRNSIANAPGLRLSCINSSKCRFGMPYRCLLGVRGSTTDNALQKYSRRTSRNKMVNISMA